MEASGSSTRRRTVAIACLMLLASATPLLMPAGAVTTSDSDSTLRIDAWVEEKAAGVGDTVTIRAQTEGDSAAALVTASILWFDMDALDSVLNRQIPDIDPVEADLVSLQKDGTWGDISNWSGTWTVPINANGGLYAADVVLLDGAHSVHDNMTQISGEIIEGIEEVLQELHDLHSDTIAPTIEEVRDLLQDMQDNVTSRGGWSDFVADGTDSAPVGDLTGGSRALWADMISAGEANESLAGGAEFLEALMAFSESDDMTGLHASLMAILLYLAELPVPEEIEDFDDLADYLELLDPMQNLTRMEGTDDISDAWESLTGSSDWAAMESAIDDLELGERPFAAFQTLVTALGNLVGSTDVEDLIGAAEAWVEMAEGDNATPLQALIGTLEGGLSDVCIGVTDEFGDCLGDTKWAFKFLMEDTTEGAAWQAWIETNEAHVSDTFDDIEGMLFGIVREVMEMAEDEAALEQVEDAANGFGTWMDGVQGEADYEVWFDDGEVETDDEEEEVETLTFFSSRYHYSEYRVCLEASDWSNPDAEVTATLYEIDGSTSTEVDSVTVTQDNAACWYDEYEDDSLGREDPEQAMLEADEIGDFEYEVELTVPANYSGYVKLVSDVDVGLMEIMGFEQMDEAFIVSSLGVLVEAPPFASTSDTVGVDVLLYGGAGALSGAEADITVARVSPQLGEAGELDLWFDVNDMGSSVQLASDVETELTVSGVSWEVEGPLSFWWDDWEEEGGVDDSGDLFEGTGSTFSFNPSEPGMYMATMEVETDEGLTGMAFREFLVGDHENCDTADINSDGQSFVSVNWNSVLFEEDGWPQGEDLQNVTIDWGDGNVSVHNGTDSAWMEGNGWSNSDSHDYSMSGLNTSNPVFVSLTFHLVDGSSHGWTASIMLEEYSQEHFNNGFEGHCWLDSDSNSEPGPGFVEFMIDEGPLEIITEQVITTDANGGASLTYTPTHPGIYVVLVMGEVTNTAGANGIGAGVTMVTEASLAITGLTSVGTFSGLPVYRNSAALGSSVNLTGTATGLDAAEAHNLEFGTVALDLSEVFPGVEGAFWGSEDEADVDLDAGTSAGSASLTFDAPLQLLAVSVNDPEANDEGGDFPLAARAGLVLSGDEDVTLVTTDDVGPGQTATFTASHGGGGTVERVLALAAPAEGIDGSSVDLNGITGFLYRNSRAEMQGLEWWADETPDEMCHEIEVEVYTNTEGGTVLDVTITAWLHDINAGNLTVTSENGTLIAPTDTWNDGTQDSWNAEYALEPGIYTIGTSTGDVEVRIEDPGDDWSEYIDLDTCEDDFASAFDELFGDLGSVAWALGDEADLRLPTLAAPDRTYAVIGLVQVELSNGDTVVAIASAAQATVPNPAPPELHNLTVSWSPLVPQVGSTVVVTVLNGTTPVPDLSALLYKDGVLQLSLLTDDGGQVDFTMPSGTLTVYISGGGFNAFEFTIVDGIPNVPVDNSTTPGDNGTNGTNGTDGSGGTDGDSDSSGGFVPGFGLPLALAVSMLGALVVALRRRDETL